MAEYSSKISHRSEYIRLFDDPNKVVFVDLPIPIWRRTSRELSVTRGIRHFYLVVGRISGSRIHDIPCKLPRKIAPPPNTYEDRYFQNAHWYGIRSANLNNSFPQQYYNFVIDGPNQRFLNGDFVVMNGRALDDRGTQETTAKTTQGSDDGNGNDGDGDNTPPQQPPAAGPSTTRGVKRLAPTDTQETDIDEEEAARIRRRSRKGKAPDHTYVPQRLPEDDSDYDEFQFP